jgi:hypothetical protein
MATAKNGAECPAVVVFDLIADSSENVVRVLGLG